jgi:hypothetical protein
VALFDVEYLRPFSGFVTALADLDGLLSDPTYSLRVDHLSLDLPIEIAVAIEVDGRLNLSAGPPTQHLETSTMPAIHHIRMEVMPRGDDEL